ncbi:MAG: ATP-binding protein, partial [Gammaproteobacteria bacterium]|nr:ATP-binding protein [Gammaproteobacteria bacterium]
MNATLDNPIGRLIATESKPTTTSNVRFWLDPDARLKPFDIVRMVPPNKGDGEFYVIIDEISQVTDEHSLLTGFISSDFGQPTVQPRVNRVATTYADGTVLYNTKNNEMPVPYGSTVHWPEKEGVRKALGIADIRNPVPAGFITMSGPKRESMSIPVDMDADYLIGPEGAHINISGISGLATKTSYAMFLLSAIQQIQQKQESSAVKSAFVILNVKGDDLLLLDEDADNLTDDEKKQWRDCGLEARPFQNVSYFYPFSRTEHHNHVQSYIGRDQLQKQLKKKNAYRYHYDAATAISRLRFLFEDMEDPNQTLVSCAEHAAESFPPIDSPSWPRFKDKVKEWAGKTPVKEIPVVSWRRFSRLTNQRTNNDLFAEKVNEADRLFQVPLRH